MPMTGKALLVGVGDIFPLAYSTTPVVPRQCHQVRALRKPGDMHSFPPTDVSSSTNIPQAPETSPSGQHTRQQVYLSRYIQLLGRSPSPA